MTIGRYKVSRADLNFTVDEYLVGMDDATDAESSIQRLAITGGAGRIATALRDRLTRTRREVMLLDIRDPSPPADLDRGETFHSVGLDDVDRLAELFRGMSLIVHLGGLPTEHSWEEIRRVNIDGTYAVLEAARRSGVPSVILASSIHAVGYHPVDAVADVPVPAPRPDSFYGVSKVAMEALGSLYADRCGLRVLSLRIANFGERPHGLRGLSIWLSPDDMARAVESFLVDTTPGHRIAWGVSDNTRRVVDLSEGRAFGFEPADDAERYAHLVANEPEPGDELLAGDFLAPGREPGKEF